MKQKLFPRGNETTNANENVCNCTRRNQCYGMDLIKVKRFKIHTYGRHQFQQFSRMTT
jgi:hypothetical protein